MLTDHKGIDLTSFFVSDTFSLIHVPKGNKTVFIDVCLKFGMRGGKRKVLERKYDT